MRDTGKVYGRGLKKLKKFQKQMVYFDKCNPNKDVERFDDFDNI